MPSEHIHFVTGRLAEPALRQLLPELAQREGFAYTVQVLPITVAALMTPAWIARRLEVPSEATQVMLPGYCDGDLSPIEAVTDLLISVGPKDLRRLPEHFGQPTEPPDLSEYDIQIIAEINHAPKLSLDQIIGMAESFRCNGADLIDVGCLPNQTWPGVGDCVQSLVELGFRVSVDSLNPKEIQSATEQGAELVLSVNQTNRAAAADWRTEVVVIPDDVRDIASMEETMEWLSGHGIPFRIDPILEPIGLGFAASLNRYFEARRRWPDVEMMMGIGNLTELTDVDSAGINFLLLAVCQELNIRSVLTTEVINWARSSVRECDIARRLVHFANRNGVPPKRLSDQLVMLRDPKLLAFTQEQIEQLAGEIRDRNYRILAQEELIHLIGGGQHLAGADPFDLFDALMDTDPENVDPSHAFYLGFEMCKAMTALQLGKQYTQDQELDWGHLTVPETTRHRLKRRTDRSEKKRRTD